MRIFARGTLRTFWEKHADCEQQLKAWYREASLAKWKSPNDIKKEYPSASILVDDRVVFNIKVDHYRLIVKFKYEFAVGYTRFVGTHAEYDKIAATKI